MAEFFDVDYANKRYITLTNEELELIANYRMFQENQKKDAQLVFRVIANENANQKKNKSHCTPTNGTFLF